MEQPSSLDLDDDDDDDEDGISMELQRLDSVEQDLRQDLVHAELEWKSGRDFFSGTTTTTTTPTSVSSSRSCLPTSDRDEPLVPIHNEQQEQEQPLVSVVTLEEEDETEAETLSQESGDLLAEPEDELYDGDQTHESAHSQQQHQQPQGWSFALAADALASRMYRSEDPHQHTTDTARILPAYWQRCEPQRTSCHHHHQQQQQQDDDNNKIMPSSLHQLAPSSSGSWRRRSNSSSDTTTTTTIPQPKDVPRHVWQVGVPLLGSAKLTGKFLLFLPQEHDDQEEQRMVPVESSLF